jgi:hypothetical protein
VSRIAFWYRCRACSQYDMKSYADIAQMDSLHSAEQQAFLKQAGIIVDQLVGRPGSYFGWDA